MANEVKIKLTIADRLRISSLYPRESDLMTQIVVKGLSDKLNITPDEQKKVGLKNDGTMFTWNAKETEEKEFTLSLAEVQTLKTQVDKLDKEKKVSRVILDLCLKIKEL